ncbi:MAG: VOC family protein [Acidobacteria bacterium]|nr:VOC family protein [Acidobacteriota bacterium]
MALNTYLTFDGNCREAFEFYRSVFGGEFTEFQTFGDGPPDMPVAEEEKNRVMHVALPIGSSVLMGSDTSSFAPPHAAGNNFSLSIDVESRERCDELCAKLSAGGSVIMPLQEQFWGAYFGQWTDRFGINWMVNYTLPTE